MQLPDILPYELEDDLWQGVARDRQPRQRVYQPQQPMVVLGRGSRPENELHTPAVVADGVPVYRRRGGGCAVVLDPGNVIVACAAPVSGIDRTREYFHRLNQWLLDALARLGIKDVRQDGISDLVQGDRKVGGTCLYRPRGVLLYSASLLVRPQLELISMYLSHPPREPSYRRQRSHADFLAALSPLDTSTTVASFARQLDQDLPPHPLSEQ